MTQGNPGCFDERRGIDGALADVVYYVSPEGSRTLRETVSEALLIIFDGGTPTKAPRQTVWRARYPRRM